MYCGTQRDPRSRRNIIIVEKTIFINYCTLFDITLRRSRSAPTTPALTSLSDAISPAFEVIYEGGTAPRVPPGRRISSGRTDWRTEHKRWPSGVPSKFYVSINHRCTGNCTRASPTVFGQGDWTLRTIVSTGGLCSPQGGASGTI